jgi:hypothetical protein
LKTLPYFVGDLIIMAQQIVCQEKNIILEKYFLRAAKNAHRMGKKINPTRGAALSKRWMRGGAPA